MCPNGCPRPHLWASVVVAFIISGIVLKLIGSEPLRIYGFFFRATFGSWAAFSDTMVKATPLIMVGLACAVAFKMKLWNIGAEGQFYMGAFFASLVVLLPILPPETPKWILLPAMAIMGMIGGAIWGFFPGYLKAKFNVNEIITTLMLNYVAILWNNFWIFDRWSDAGFQMTPTFARSAWLPRLSDLCQRIPDLFRHHPAPGGALRGRRRLCGLVGDLPQPLGLRDPTDRRQPARRQVCRAEHQPQHHSGDDVLRCPGWAGGHVRGERGGPPAARAISPGYGFTGIIVAWLAKLNPFAVILVSILFGALIVAGREVQPSGIAQMLQGVVLFMVISSDVLLRYKVRLVRRDAVEA